MQTSQDLFALKQKVNEQIRAVIYKRQTGNNTRVAKGKKMKVSVIHTDAQHK